MEISMTSTAIFAGGCFWCIEAVFNRIDGVQHAVSGYINGNIDNPTYQQVCTGLTGHAEAVRIDYDPAVISYRDLLEILFTIHDPTQLNRQGNDKGTQYRSGIYYLDEEQKNQATEFIQEMSSFYGKPIVTEILPAQTFWRAEDYHQHYFVNHPEEGYCQMVIAPKILKARNQYFDRWLED